jgi:hypothetical protein
MKPLIVLLAVFGVSCLATFIAGHPADYYFCGRLAMGVMLIFAATAHFKVYPRHGADGTKLYSL